MVLRKVLDTVLKENLNLARKYKIKKWCANIIGGNSGLYHAGYQLLLLKKM